MSILVLKMRSYELLNLTLRYNLFDSFFQCLSAQSMYMNIILLCFNLFIPGECSDITDVTKFDFLPIHSNFVLLHYLCAFMIARYASNINIITQPTQ